MTVNANFKITIDYGEIRSLVEARGGRPARDSQGRPALDFSGELEEIAWKDFFVLFEEEHLALSYDEDGDFCALVERRGLDERAERTSPY